VTLSNSPQLPGLKALCRVHGPFVAKAKTLEEFNKTDEWCPLCLKEAERAARDHERRQLRGFATTPRAPSDHT
jgi:hypothetical protein